MRVFDFPQYSDEWWATRRAVPTASQFHNIITPKKGDFASAAFSYACALIAEKYDGNYGPQSEFATAAMRNGSIMEPEARRYYEFHSGCDVQRVGFCLSACGRFGASPDALIADDGLLELKNPTAEVQVRYLLDGGLPEVFKPQTHGQLIVTGRKWVDLLSYHPGLPKLLIRVEPDEFTEKLRGYLEQFWTLYQELLTRITKERDQAIAEEIRRKGDQLPDDLKALAPPVLEASWF